MTSAKDAYRLWVLGRMEGTKAASGGLIAMTCAVDLLRLLLVGTVLPPGGAVFFDDE